MDITDLEPPELLALVGLAKIVVRADKELSQQEHDALQGWAAILGEERWATVIEEAGAQFHSRTEVMAFARTIERQEARNLIYGQLYHMAHADALVQAEARFLHDLSEMWEIAEQIL